MLNGRTSGAPDDDGNWPHMPPHISCIRPGHIAVAFTDCALAVPLVKICAVTSVSAGPSPQYAIAVMLDGPPVAKWTSATSTVVDVGARIRVTRLTGYGGVSGVL